MFTDISKKHFLDVFRQNMLYEFEVFQSLPIEVLIPPLLYQTV